MACFTESNSILVGKAGRWKTAAYHPASGRSLVRGAVLARSNEQNQERCAWLDAGHKKETPKDTLFYRLRSRSQGLIVWPRPWQKGNVMMEGKPIWSASIWRQRANSHELIMVIRVCAHTHTHTHTRTHVADTCPALMPGAGAPPSSRTSTLGPCTPSSNF